jgi:protein-disulfide isomerase
MNRYLMLASALLTLGVGACQNNSNSGRENPTVESPGSGSGTAAAPAGAAGHQYDPADQWALAGAPVKGAETAIVTIVEFSEFQCPFCSRVNPTISQILETPEFAGKVRVVFKHLPLGFHDRARPAAIASMAAHRQGKFWEFHDLAFQNQRDLTDANFTAWATQLGLNLEQFAADMADPAIATQVDADAALAGTLGIQGTPNFLINGRPLTGAQPFDAFAAAIREEITATEALITGGQSAQQAFASRIEANAAARTAANAPQQQQARPEPDPAQELRVPVGDSAAKGPEDALITIVEFSEFQCPFCSRVGSTLAQIQERYGNDVRIVFKHLPLDFHDRALPAARAAIAAQNQGKFWEYHDLMFANQQALSDDDLIRYAEQLGLNLDTFRADMASPATQARIDADVQLAGTLRAQGTPHFFVNGIRVVGAQPFENFQRVIDEQLALANAAIAGGASRATIYDTLQADASAEVRMITPPGGAPTPPARPEPDPAAEMFVPIGESDVKGGAEALVTIVEFSEFQCPFCSRVGPTLAQLQTQYGDQIRIVFKHRPLDFHDRAMPAARAAIAAQNQGKGWEYHDLLFANQQALSDEDLIRYAEQLGLNLDTFRADMASPATQARIDADVALADRLAARGTPHFFVNGIRLRGAQPLENFQRVIDEQLAIANAAIAGGASRANLYDTLQADAIQGPAPMITPGQ